MILGIGTDIIEVKRVAEKIAKNSGFTEKVFSVGERSYCESTSNCAQHFAARFAAKEAFLKATGAGLTATYDLNEIEIVQDPLGKPSLILTGKMSSMAVHNGWNRIHVSLSHVQEMACAVVIIEQ